jgi:hypothetical protein
MARGKQEAGKRKSAEWFGMDYGAVVFMNCPLMNSSSFELLYYANVGTSLLISLITLAIVAVGWRRYRLTGYLVLSAWSVGVLLSILFRILVLPSVQRHIGRGSKFNPNEALLMSSISTLTGISMHVLLCVGLAMLVFGTPRPR